MQILYQTSPLSGVRAAVWLQEVETSPCVGTQKRRAVLLEKKHRLFQNPNAHILLLFSAWHQSHETSHNLRLTCCERRNLLARRRRKHSPCFLCLDEGRKCCGNYDVLTLLTGLFHKSESADLKSKWKLTRTYIYHLHHHHYIAQIACRKYLQWFFVIPCLDCLQSLGKGEPRLRRSLSPLLDAARVQSKHYHIPSENEVLSYRLKQVFQHVSVEKSMESSFRSPAMLNVAGTASERKWLFTHVLVRMGSVRVVCSQAKKSSSQQQKILYKEVFKKMWAIL